MHQVIVGRTLTGKTTLARALGAAAVREHIEVIAYNPIGDYAFIRPKDGQVAATGEHQSPGAFLEHVHRSVRARSGKQILLLIDEATTFFDHPRCDREWMATRGRHMGLNLVLICQYFNRLNPIVRGQCEVLYLFKSGLKSAEVCADEYGEPGLRDARALKKGHYLRVDIDGLTPGKVF